MVDGMAAAVAVAPPAAAPMPPLPFELDLLRRGLAGQLEDQEAAHLICRLLQLYPPQRRSAPSVV